VKFERLILKVLLYLIVREFDGTRDKYPGRLVGEIRAAIEELELPPEPPTPPQSGNTPEFGELGTTDWSGCSRSWDLHTTPPLGQGRMNL
jgi:hypothetical protein